MHRQMCSKIVKLMDRPISQLILVLVVVMVWTTQVQAISTEALKQGIPSLAPMLEIVTPAVVNIRVTRVRPSSARFFSNGEQLPDEVRRFFRELPQGGIESLRRPSMTGAGSGVIIDAQRGFVVTNHHVVEHAANITVQLSDGRSVEAELLGSDAGTDIALLQIMADSLVDIEFADITTVQVGDYVVAIGNPYGIGQTVTSGIVSALGRAGLNRDHYEDFIQTDAAINVGNSGGALVDMEGRLIGINTAILSGNGGSNGIGFAIPSDMVAAVKEHLERDGEVRRGLLDVSITDVTADVRLALNVDVGSGAVVTNVLADSGAARAGIEISDVIVEIDGRAVNGSRQLRNIVGLMRQDQEVELGLYRDGERMNLSATIGGARSEASGVDRRPASTAEFRGSRLRTRELTEAGDTGVDVLSVRRQSRAWTAGLRAGDVITHLNRQAIDDLAAFEALAADAERLMALTVIRDGQEMLLFVP